MTEKITFTQSIKTDTTTEKFEFVSMVPVFEPENAGRTSGDAWGFPGGDDVADEDDDAPLVISGISVQLYEEIERRVQAIQPSLVPGTVYADGEICGVDWWLSLDPILQCFVGTAMRQPQFLRDNGFAIVPYPDEAFTGYVLSVDH